MDKKLVGLITLFFLSFFVFTSILVFRRPLLNLARAKEDQMASATNSKIILACPGTTVAANGNDTCPVYVFVRSSGESPKPLSNKVVTLTTSMGQLDQASSTTDTLGKASFSLRSSEVGVANLRATVAQDSGPIEISTQASVEFK